MDAHLNWDEQHVYLTVAGVQIRFDHPAWGGLVKSYLAGNDLQGLPLDARTHRQTRETFLAALAAGATTCPTCDRSAVRQHRNVHREMAQFMVELVRLSQASANPGAWFSTRDVLGLEGIPKASTDAAYLLHFGLLERSGRGMYRPTAAGWAWVHGKRTIWSHFWSYDGRVEQYDGEQINIEAALGRVPEVTSKPFVPDTQQALPLGGVSEEKS